MHHHLLSHVTPYVKPVTAPHRPQQFDKAHPGDLTKKCCTQHVRDLHAACNKTCSKPKPYPYYTPNTPNARITAASSHLLLLHSEHKQGAKVQPSMKGRCGIISVFGVKRLQWQQHSFNQRGPFKPNIQCR